MPRFTKEGIVHDVKFGCDEGVIKPYAPGPNAGQRGGERRGRGRARPGEAAFLPE